MSHFSKSKASKKKHYHFYDVTCCLGSNCDRTEYIDAIIESKPLNVESNKGKQEMSSNINLILWLMGFKQNLDTTILPIDTTGKRQLRTSGTV